MPDVEFLDTPGAGGDDELLDTGPPRRAPRWLPPLALFVVLAVVLAVVVLRNDGGTPSAGPSSSSVPSGPSAVPSAAGTGQAADVAGDFDIVGDEHERRLFALAGDRLSALALDGTTRARAVVVLGAPKAANYALVLDAVHHLVWTVPQTLTAHTGSDTGIVQAFDTRTLRLRGRYVLPEQVDSATALDGRLYLGGLGRVLVLDRATRTFATVVRRPATDLVVIADPHRHRVLYVQYGTALSVGSWSPTVSVAPVALPFPTGRVVVVGSTIWAGGTGGAAAQLSRLDPATLQPGRDLARARGFDANFGIVGAGAHSLYVNNDGDGRIRVQCLAGDTGRRLAVFPETDNRFVSVAGRGYDASPDGVRPVRMGRCPG